MQATYVSTRSDPPEQSPSKQQSSPERVANGISAFLARVLDQLSVSSWLPAVFFVGNAAILLVLKNKDQLDVSVAIRQLVELEWGALVVLLFAVIIVATVIQAFEFESLRFWEGYFRSALSRRWADRRITRYQSKIRDLEKELQERRLAAFDSARRRALSRETPAARTLAHWNAMEKVIHGWDLDDGEEDIADEAALTLHWPSHADPTLLHAWDVTRLKRQEFPSPHRVMPTRLGNVMRMAEDHVQLGVDEDLEGFMIRHLDELPPTIVSEHAAYQRRLEMYCGLMFVLCALCALSAVCLWHHSGDIVWRIVVPMAYALAVLISYKAAIASALGFGQALKEANAWVQGHEVVEP